MAVVSGVLALWLLGLALRPRPGEAGGAWGVSPRARRLGSVGTLLLVSPALLASPCGVGPPAPTTALGTHGFDRLFYATDHLGSTIVAVDEAGDLQSRFHFMPFGDPGAVEEGQPLRHRFAGGVVLEETGLYALGPRLYDPEVGRFLQPDPLVADPGDPQALNRYAYAYNNPLAWIDPSGLASISPCSLTNCEGGGGSFPQPAPGNVPIYTPPSLDTGFPGVFDRGPGLDAYLGRSGQSAGSGSGASGLPALPVESRVLHAPRTGEGSQSEVARQTGGEATPDLTPGEQFQRRYWLQQIRKEVTGIFDSGRAPMPKGLWTIESADVLATGLPGDPSRAADIGISFGFRDLKIGRITIYPHGATSFDELFISYGHEVGHFNLTWTEDTAEAYGRGLLDVYKGQSYRGPKP